MSFFNKLSSLFGAAGAKEPDESEFKHFEYSTLDDSDTCDTCRSWEGRTAKRSKDLPPAPHPQCTSQEGCRCFVVGVGKDEGQPV